jgi:hypothetical protein
MPNTRSSVNQVVQLGTESTPGTGVAAAKLLSAFTWTFGAKPVTKQNTGTGRKYPQTSALLTEMSMGKISGPGDFAGLVYPLSGVYGAASSIALVGAATTAYAWTFKPPIAGVASPKTFTAQQGDGVDAEQYTYVLFTGWGYSFDRQQEVAITGDWFSRPFTDGISMTGSPTNVTLSPMTGAQYSVYLDATSANIGTTLLSLPMKLDFAASGYYKPKWVINRANASFLNHTELRPKNELKLTLEADSTGIAIRGNYLEIGALCYVQVNGQGSLIENDQTVTIGSNTGGTFTLTYKGQTTSNIAYNASPATGGSSVQALLRGLSTIGATGCTVTGASPTYQVQMTGALANDTTALTGSGASLTGGSGFAIASTPFYATMVHNMACFVADMKEFGSQDDVFAVEYTLAVAEDTAWSSGTAQTLVLQNLLSGL